MTKLTATYNFARISRHVYVPGWYDQVSIDRPFSDGEDGVIEVRLRNVSPLFTRDGQPAKHDKKEETPYSAHLLTSDGKRLYYLPATSVKGMLRMTLEAMAFGKMKQFVNRSFGYRDFGGKGTQSDYIKKVTDVRGGWLEKDGEHLYLTPCDGDFETITISEVNRQIEDFDNHKSAWQRNSTAGFYPLIPYKDREWHLVATGKIDSKKVEYLFPVDEGKRFPVPVDVAQAFMTIHEQTPDFDKFMDRLNNDRIAVFYIPDKVKKVKVIGMAKMLKYPYEKSLRQILDAQQDQPKGRDLAEVIFGYIDSKGNEFLRGRVHVGNAFAAKPIEDSELCDLQKGVLAQPKASFYPLYLKQDHNPYKTYNNPDGLAGRKLYRIHKGNTVTQLPLGNSNENLITGFLPVPEGQEFSLNITVHNLRPIETGALLSALTLHETKGCYHNLGLAKGFGYGKLEILSVNLRHLAYGADYYLKTFEKEMSVFSMSYNNRMWNNSEEVTSFLQTLSEHEDEELAMMPLKDFREVSKQLNFNTLKERRIAVTSKLTPDDMRLIQESIEQARLAIAEQQKKEAKLHAIQKCRSDYKSLIEEADTLLRNGNVDLAKMKYQEIEDKTLKIYNVSLSEITAALKTIDQLIQQKEDERIRLEQKEREEKINAGFDAFINEKNLLGEYKVRNFKVCETKTIKWLKDSGRQQLTDEEKAVFKQVIERLAKNPSKNEAKAWKDKNSFQWRKIRQFLGEN